MKFLSKVKLSNRRYKTPEGYLVCVDSIIARTGKQEYLKSEIFQDSNDDSVIQIDRPKSEVLSPSTIASFENKPLVDEHPDEDVNVDNYRDYAIGFARDVRASKLDDTDILIANLIFTDPEAIAEIESGEKTELSCGYDCDILGEGNNLYQANIRGNHIALCKAGRAGIARIQDSKIKDSRVYAYVDKKDIESTYRFESYAKANGVRVVDLGSEYRLEGEREDLEYVFDMFDLDRDDYIEDSVKDSKYSEKLKDLSPEERLSKIDELIADEEEAIVGYKEAMKYANEADKSIYAHIIAEELEHITELKTLRAENFEKNNINDAGTTRRMFRESEIGDENSWFGTTDWGTPKGNMYIYRKNGKIIAEGVYNDWYNDLQKGEKKEFNSVKELNKWLNTFTEDSNIKDIEKKEFTYKVDSYEKVTKDEENKKMRDGALRGIHLKKIRNTLRNEDEDLVEDFLDYMDTRPDLVKEYDDYSDYMVREDFETWKKYKKIKTRDVDTYEEVTEGLEKELKDSKIKDSKKLLNIIKLYKKATKDSMTEAQKLLEKNNIKVNKITGQDKNFYLWLEDKTKGNEAVNILSKEYDDVKKYIDSTTKAVKIRVGAGLDNVSFNKKEVERAINNLGYTVKRWYAYGGDSVAVIDDKYINMDGYPYFNQQVKKLKRFGFAKDIYVDDNEIVFEGAKFNIKDSDTLKNLAYKFAQMGNYFDRANSVNSRKILGKEDDEKIAEFYNLGLQVYKQLEKEVDYLKNNKEPLESPLSFWRDNETVDLLVDGAERLIWIRNPKCEALGNKIRNLIKDYKKYNYKDSKVKDSMTKVNIETSLSIFDLQKAARKFDVIVILSNYTDHVYAILKGEKEDIGDLLSYLDNKGVLMKYPKGF